MALSFSCWKRSSHFLLVCKSLLRNLLITLWGFPCIKEFFSCCFYNSLCFYIVLLWSSWRRWIGINILWWHISFVNLDVQISPQFWEVLSHYFFKKLSSFSPLLLSFEIPVVHTLSIWCPVLNSHRFLHSFLSSGWVVSDSSCLLISLFCLFKSAIEAFYWFLQISHCILHLQSFYWVLLCFLYELLF